MPHLLILGASDAGISAALRAKEIRPDADVAVVSADAYPNFSICGFQPLSVQLRLPDHKPYYPEAQPLDIRLTADRTSHSLLYG